MSPQGVAVDRMLVSILALKASYALLHEPLGHAENHNAGKIIFFMETPNTARPLYLRHISYQVLYLNPSSSL